MTTAAFTEFSPSLWPLPHPSPRNNIWLKKNPWFTREVLPELWAQVKCALNNSIGSNDIFHLTADFWQLFAHQF